MATSTDSSGGQAQTPVVILPDAMVGKRIFRAHRAAHVDLTEANRSLQRPMELILGYPAWCQADWLFDFPAWRWALTS